MDALRHVFWAASATIVVVCIVLAALGAVDPGDAVALTAVVLALAALWLVHEWRGLFEAERRSRPS